MNEILKKVVFVLILLQVSAFGAGPTGIITDLYDMELGAINDSAKKTANSVMEQKMEALKS